MNKTGNALVWALKKADLTRKQFRDKPLRFNSFTVECTVPPSLELSFTPRNKDKEEEKQDGMREFLKSYGLERYEDKLIEAGAESLDDLKELNEDDVAKLVKQIEFKLLHKTKFIKACQALNDDT